MQPAGPSNARVMIVGEAPGEREEQVGSPFVGPSGEELNRMLHEAGLSRAECFLTNVCHARPPKNDMSQWMSKNVHPPKPSKKVTNTQWVRWLDCWAHPAVAEGYDQLLKHIDLVRPTLIIALGNTALKALTGKFGIKSWRGSMLWAEFPGGHACKVIPTYHPAAVLREWTIRAITVHDLRRAAREAKTPTYNVPNYNFIIRPNFSQAVQFLGQIKLRLSRGPTKLSIDIETRGGHTACTGIATSKLEAICIPWMCTDRKGGYWTEDEEIYLWNEFRYIMSHSNCQIVGQNWLYDSQYKWRFFFVKTYPWWDTMVSHHCMLPGTPKGLDVLASMHCQHYVYWKDDGRLWNPGKGDDQQWKYNCQDCVYTWEIFESQQPVIENDERLRGVWEFQTHKLLPMLFRAMVRGVKIDLENRAKLAGEITQMVNERQQWLCDVLGHDINVNSSMQMQKLFYIDFGEKKILKKGTFEVTCDDSAMEAIAKRNPLLRGLCKTIQEIRSLRTFYSNFIEMRLDRDNRARSSYNPAGTSTFRLSSSEDAFGSGRNLQNIPGESKETDPGALKLPNIRKLFKPDDGHFVWDMDLDRADLQVVVWEADDEELRTALELGVDLHLLNSGSVFGIKELNLENLKDAEFVKYAKGKYPKQRAFAKAWTHACNYGAGERTLAIATGTTVAENTRYRAKWFHDHPGIKGWHDRTQVQLNRFRWVENKFGYRFTFFDRPDALLPEALAWVPQSTVGCVINRAWYNIEQQIPEVEMLIQVHDSLVGQARRELREDILARIPEVAKVVVPYDRPLIIPVGIKWSEKSWGECE